MSSKDSTLERVRAERGKYHEAIGRFILLWADVEESLFDLLGRYANLTDEIACALFLARGLGT